MLPAKKNQKKPKKQTTPKKQKQKTQSTSLPSFLSLPLQRVITSQHWSAFWQWFPPFPLFSLFKASAPKRKGKKKKAGGPK